MSNEELELSEDFSLVESTEELPEGFVEAQINPELSLLPVEDEVLTEQQKEAFDNINKMFALKQEAIISAMLDGLAEKFRFETERAKRKVENKKGKRIYQYDAGYLKAFEEIFNSLYSFLYTVKEQPIVKDDNNE